MKHASHNSRYRLGIYPGAFDPVHAGHIAFALQALEASKLDEVMFIPERNPRFRPAPEHFAHRVAMLKSALAPYSRLSLLETVDARFTPHKSIPRLQGYFSAASLVYLAGADTIDGLMALPHAWHLFSDSDLVINYRPEDDRSGLEEIHKRFEGSTGRLYLLEAYAPEVSSSRIRQALRARRYTKGLLSSVKRYAEREWLYVSPAYHGL